MRSAAGEADVAVVIPVHDRAALLAAALDSVAVQSVAPVSVVVVDDASADGSGEVGRSRGATVVRRDEAGGPGVARNAGLATTSATWVAFLDSDDLWAPDHLERLLAAAAAEPDAVLVTAPSLTTIGRWHGLAPRTAYARFSLVEFLVPGDGIVVSGTMVRREAALAVGGFPALRAAEDAALWLRLLREGVGVATAYPTVSYAETPSDDRLSDELGDRIRDAFEEVVEAEVGDLLTAGLRVRHRARQVWDRMRAAQRDRDPAGVRRGLVWFGRHPGGLLAVRDIAAHRRRARAAMTALPADRRALLLGRTGEFVGGSPAQRPSADQS